MIQGLISIIVAAKNAERFLPQALDSIAAQDYDNYEIIVVDGQSTDNSIAIAESYPKVTCVTQLGMGYANAWNTGIAFARGQFIAFLDSDDIWIPDKLSSQMAIFESKPRTEFVFGRVRFFLEPGCLLPNGFRSDVLEGSHLSPMTGTLMLRRSILDRVGPFDEHLKIASDIPWIAKLRETAVAEHVDKVLLNKRLHGSNLGHTTSLRLFQRELLAVMKQRIDALHSAIHAKDKHEG